MKVFQYTLTYLNGSGSYEFIQHNINSKANKDGTQTDEIKISLKLDEEIVALTGTGNGPIDAMVSAIKNIIKLYN